MQSSATSSTLSPDKHLLNNECEQCYDDDDNLILIMAECYIVERAFELSSGLYLLFDTKVLSDDD